LTTLDVSNNTALIRLSCSDNKLTGLDVSNHTALTLLECSENQLTTLNVSNNMALTSLKCNNNQLTTLDVSNNTALTSLICSNNQLTTLDISRHTALTFLNCNNNQLITLDISRLTALKWLYCDGNPLTDVTVGWARPPQMGGLSMPSDVSSATLHVPVGSKALYRAAEVWKDFGTILEPGETGIQTVLPSFEVYASDGSIYINSPVAEQIDVYSTSGALLYRATKPVGATTIHPTRFPQGVLIVRGSSGWVKKVAIVFDKSL
jgi:hypothetical protein